MRRLAPPTALAAALALAGCAGPRPATPTAGAPPGACPAASELRFTRETACRNDGSVEFCVPRDDPALDARIRAIVPVARVHASRGRAGCDRDRQRLYLVETGSRGLGGCEGHDGPMSEAGWARLCRLAALPEIEAVHPTWFE